MANEKLAETQFIFQNGPRPVTAFWSRKLPSCICKKRRTFAPRTYLLELRSHATTTTYKA